MKKYLMIIFVVSVAMLSVATEPAPKIYVCPDCGCASDKVAFDKPGSCPSCAMALVEAKDPHELERRPTPPTSAMHFPKGKSSVTFPFELLANAILFPVHVNGRGPFLFELDTGSFNSPIASELASEIGIEASGTNTGFGAGSGSSGVGKIRNLEFEFPEGVTATTRPGPRVSMSALWPLMARHIYGDIGHDVVRNCVLQIDYEKKLITLYDPVNYHYAGKAEPIPFTLWGNYDPQIDGELMVNGEEPISVKFTIDTGAGGTAVTTPLVEAHHLREKVGKVLPAFDNGVGGWEPKVVVARLVGLRIARYRIQQPLAALTSDTQGSFSSKTLGINLGGNILRRFTVIIDYPHKQLILEPNAHLDDPFNADASGLVLKASGDNFKTFSVRAVVPDSPAVEAGVQTEDRITAVNGEPLDKYALWQVQELLQKAGTTCELSVERGDKKFTAKMDLRSLL
jgi:hypothetical protein